jgi:hypothetical protein
MKINKTPDLKKVSKNGRENLTTTTEKPDHHH